MWPWNCPFKVEPIFPFLNTVKVFNDTKGKIIEAKLEGMFSWWWSNFKHWRTFLAWFQCYKWVFEEYVFVELLCIWWHFSNSVLRVSTKISYIVILLVLGSSSSLKEPTHEFFFHKSLFYPQMTPKTLKIFLFWHRKSEKMTLKKVAGSQPL